ncbi:MAG TPA: hypothetical protein VF126_17990, partial [Acidobacteriaceae bacterium]
MIAPVLRALLAGLIDYAGLFPPAALSMAETVRNYDGYIHGEHAWMLGRLIVPAARLAEYADALHGSGLDATDWRLSALATAADAETICLFNDGPAEYGRIDTLEIKAADVHEIECATVA